jgi:predicted nucleic acid-binding protein
VSVYLDASFLVSLYSTDAFSQRAIAFLRATKPVLVVSDFAAAEFASAISKRVRVSQMTDSEGRRAIADFDTSAPQAMQRIHLETTDLAAADAYLRRFELKLRTADAINVAIAQRVGSELATFDARMVAVAQSIGLATVVS